MELETHLLICVRVGLLKETQAKPVFEDWDQWGQMIYRLIQALCGWKPHHSPPADA